MTTVVFTRKQPRRRQPAIRGVVDFSSPLLQGTTGFWQLGAAIDTFDEVSGVRASVVSPASYSIKLAPEGISPSQPSSKAYFDTNILGSALGISGSANRTIYGLVMPSPQDNSAIFEHGTPTNQDWSFRSLTAGSSWRLNIFGVLGADATYVPTTNPISFICTQSGTTVSYWINGAQRYSNTAAVNTHDATFKIGAGVYWAAWLNNIFFIGVAPRAWSDVEKRAFSEKPWSVYRPVRRRAYFDIGAGPPPTFLAAWANRRTPIIGAGGVH